jgi:hypothetical protein
MAESQLLELEITYGKIGLIFSPEQRQRMENHIEELRKLTKGPAEQSPPADRPRD